MNKPQEIEYSPYYVPNKISSIFIDEVYHWYNFRKTLKWSLYSSIKGSVLLNKIDEFVIHSKVVSSIYDTFNVLNKIIKQRGYKSKSFSLKVIFFLNNYIRDFLAKWNKKINILYGDYIEKINNKNIKIFTGIENKILIFFICSCKNKENKNLNNCLYHEFEKDFFEMQENIKDFLSNEFWKYYKKEKKIKNKYEK